MRWALPLLAVTLAGCNSSAVVRTGLTARMSPIEVKGVRIEAEALPKSSPPSLRMAKIVSTPPPQWSGLEYEVMLTRDHNPDSAGSSGMSGKGRQEMTTSVGPGFDKGDDRIFGRLSLFVTKDEDLVIPDALIEEVAPGCYGLRLDKEVTLTTPSGQTVTFPVQANNRAAPMASPKQPAIMVRLKMVDTGRPEAIASLIPSDFRAPNVSASIVDERGFSRITSKQVTPGQAVIDWEFSAAYPSKKVGKVGPFRLRVRHRADLDVIPFAIIAKPAPRSTP